MQRPALKVTGAHETESIECPLCRNIASEFFADGQRVYLRCDTCGLIFLHPVARPTAVAEALRYRQHRNDAGDERYLAFLRRLADPLAQSLRPGARGLDFGCGPVPALAQLMTEAGFVTASYDPLFHPDEILLDARYDFVACCEVIEHVHDPHALLERFTTLLRDGGVLGVMTRFHGEEAPFHRWWYRRDPTHVCFYSEETMRWIAATRGWSVQFPATHVAIFQVPRSHAPSRPHLSFRGATER